MTTPVPSVPDFTAGYGPQQSDFQSWWVDAAAFFQQRVVFRASQTTTATSIPSSGAVTKIGFDNIIEDPYSGWSASNHWWVPPAGYSGFYLVTLEVVMAGGGGGSSDALAIYVGQGSGTGKPLAVVRMPTATVSGGCASLYVYLAGGQDQVYGAAALQNASAAVSTNLTAGQNSQLQIIWCLG